jgi:hypothetical protein
MGPINWLAVVLAAVVAGALALPYYRLLGQKPPRGFSLLALLGPAWMIGHNFARVGGATLAAKPWLYPMMSGGFALFIAVPLVVLLYDRQGLGWRAGAVDATYALLACLVMGGVFAALA